MKIGFGLYRHMLDDEHFAFARQCGATHIVAHLCDYFRKNEAFSRSDQPVGDLAGWGHADGRVWTVEELVGLRERMAKHGLVFHAIENFDPAFWCDILFAGPRRDEQMETVATVIRNVGAAGIPVFGYNFSLAGVAGRVHLHGARGGAQTVGLDGLNPVIQAPLPASMAWNMVVDPDAKGLRPPTPVDELWGRLERFLKVMVPIAEKAGVTLAAHPDDPPLEVVRGQPRLVYRPELFQKLLDMAPSPNNALEFCLGTISEMQGADVLGTLEKHARQKNIAYIHFRNVRGKAPHYEETFIDEGDIDMRRVVEILDACGYDGVIIPDHTPQMSCAAPWHAGMAFAMGYMNALIKGAAEDRARRPVLTAAE
jgi:mannonate dehydratase